MAARWRTAMNARRWMPRPAQTTTGSAVAAAPHRDRPVGIPGAMPSTAASTVSGTATRNRASRWTASSLRSPVGTA